jgi:Cof subfamily protein (haloacid dehalogenase superfamily)
MWWNVAELLPSWEAGVDSLRPFADIRLIALDVDGTLLETSRAKLPNLVGLLKRALAHPKRQVQIAIATGRAFAGVQGLFSRLDLDERTPMILYNGSVVLLSGHHQLLRRKTIEESAIARVIETCQPLGATILAYFFPDPLNWENSERDIHEKVRGWSQVSNSYEEYNGIAIEWQKDLSGLRGNNPVSMLVDTRNNPSAKNDVEAYLSEIPSLSCTSSGYPYVEVRPVGSNKGEGLAVVARHMGLSQHQVLAVGDNDNDGEMLRWAGIGITVAGASPAAIESSRYLCRHGVVSGVVEVMRLVRQAKRYHGMAARTES